MAYNIKIRFLAWLRTQNGRGFLIAITIVALLLILKGIGVINPKPSGEPTTTMPPFSLSDSSSADASATRDLKMISWVKDIYISPGHMNVGVIKSEKDWNSPMLGSAVCGILKRNGSNLTRVRFIDIEKVVREQIPAQSAEISLHQCY